LVLKGAARRITSGISIESNRPGRADGVCGGNSAEPQKPSDIISELERRGLTLSARICGCLASSRSPLSASEIADAIGSRPDVVEHEIMSLLKPLGLVHESKSESGSKMWLFVFGR
ncbi:MAG: helix-turn-helix domain-containing protein, partial [Methanothrix sp.]